MTDFHEHVLDNGLRIVAEVNDAAYSAAMGFFVKTGARDESSDLMGVSHFLEHMMFKGTRRRSAAEVDRDVNDIGARHNAWTSSEMTAFHAQCLPRHLPVAEDVLSDILRPAIREEDFEDEKGVILEEIAMYADQPFWRLYERSLETFYGGHPLGHRVLGTNETVASMKRDAMANYFEQRYSADNTIVAMAGHLDFTEMIQRLEEHCGGWIRTDTDRSYVEPKLASARFEERDDQLARHYACMVSPGPSLQSDQRYAAGMLAHILGHHEGSRLYWALVEPGLAEEAQCQFDGRDGCGEFILWHACNPGDAARCESIVLETLDELVGSLTESDLERVRSLAATAATVAGELPAGRMQRLGQIMTSTGEYRSLDEDLKRILDVTLDDLVELVETFPIKPMVTGTLGPDGSG